MRNIAIFALAVMSLVPNSAIAQDARAQEIERANSMKRATEEIAALIEAENQKSALCKSYEGQQVTVTAFDSFVRGLPKYITKGEFETTPQFDARVAAANKNIPTGPFVIVLPTNQKYIEYDADLSLMRVQAGAFDEGKFSDNTMADIKANYLTQEFRDGRTAVPHSDSERLLQTYRAQTRLGVPFSISKYDLKVNSMFVAAKKLFSYANDKYSLVMGFEVPVAQAARVKPTLKVALVVEPDSPFVITDTSDDERSPTLDRPSEYTYRSSIAFVKAKCSLVLDGQSKVLAAMDSGS